MTIGMVGLGKMGSAIARRLVQAGYVVVGFDPDLSARDYAQNNGITAVDTIDKVAQNARIIWLMVPSGKVVDTVLKELELYLQPSDIIIDGGNSKFIDSVERARYLVQKNIYFLDCGVSGGLQAQEIGFSLMVGGDAQAYRQVVPIMQAVSTQDGYGYMGPSGAGHYVKMVHNAIEYGLLQAYAEGFHVLKDGTYDLDLAKVADVWRHGSVIRSWLLDLTHEIFEKDQDLTDVIGFIKEGGTGRWAAQEAEEKNIPVPVLKESLDVRERSIHMEVNYATKLIALLRNKFGGHIVNKRDL